MWRQRRGGVDQAAARMRNHDPARQQMQPVLQAARQRPVLLVEIFGIADDRMADMIHVRAQLMRAPGHRLQRHPGELVRRRLHHRIIGHRVARALVAMRGDAHDRIVLALLLGEIGRDAALLRLGHADHQRPIDLARRAVAECAGQMGRGKARLGDQQAAGGLAVDPVHQPRLLPLGVAHHLQHLVDMARHAGAALHGEARRLVEDEHVVILIERHLLSTRRASCCSASDKRPATFGASSLSGGMRTLCPSSSRSLLSARLPLTRSSPLRTMRWM